MPSRTAEARSSVRPPRPSSSSRRSSSTPGAMPEGPPVVDPRQCWLPFPEETAHSGLSAVPPPVA